MTTFDIAIQHLKKVNFKKIQFVCTDKKSKDEATDVFVKELGNITYEEFISDVRNNKSNEYYRSLVYCATVYHLLFKAHDRTSFFDVTIQIIEAHIDILKTDFNRYENTAYPKIMMDAYINYCEKLKSTTLILESEVRDELFGVVFEYVVNPDEA